MTPRLFDWHYIGQKLGEDFAKFCGLLRIYELYKKVLSTLSSLGNNYPNFISTTKIELIYHN